MICSIDDLSSIEGSDSEDDSENETSAVTKLMDRISKIPDLSAEEETSPKDKEIIKSPKVYYENENGHIIGIYKSIAEVC